MSVSIDKDPADEGDARRVLASWLDDYAGGRCDRADMQESFLSVCRSNPDAPWDALALLDQYQRRGRIDAALARTLKADIAQLVFGNANQTGAPPRDPTEATLDTTGTRWRKLLAENESLADSGRRAAVRRSHAVPPRFRSATRPPPPQMREEVQQRQRQDAGRKEPAPRGAAEGRAARSLRAAVHPRARQQRHGVQGARSASRAPCRCGALRRREGSEARLSRTAPRRSRRWSASSTRRSRCRIRTSSACSISIATATRTSS